MYGLDPKHVESQNQFCKHIPASSSSHANLRTHFPAPPLPPRTAAQIRNTTTNSTDIENNKKEDTAQQENNANQNSSNQSETTEEDDDDHQEKPLHDIKKVAEHVNEEKKVPKNPNKSVKVVLMVLFISFCLFFCTFIWIKGRRGLNRERSFSMDLRHLPQA